MPGTIFIRVEGLKELQKQLDLTDKEVRKAVRLASGDIGRHMAEEMRAGVAVDTGAAKRSLGYKTLTYHGGKIFVTIIGSRRIEAGRREGRYATRYLHLIEFGSVKQSPRPFMRPVYDKYKSAAPELMGLALNKAMFRVAGLL